MTTTSTRALVLTIGTELAKEKNAETLAKKMKKIENENEQLFLQAGIQLKEVNDLINIEFMKQQWQQFVLQIVGQESRKDVLQVISELDKLAENKEITSDHSSEFKLK